jgi:hypothetical protein
LRARRWILCLPKFRQAAPRMCRLPGRRYGLFCCVRPDTRGSLRLRPRTPASRKRTSTKHPATAGSHPSVAAVPVSFPVSESTSLPASSRMGSRRCGPGRPRSTRSVWYAAGHLEPALRPARRAASPRPPGSGPAVGFARRGREVPHVRGHYHVRPARTAAARTCRSFGSLAMLGIKASCPATMASGKALSMVLT